MTFGGSEIFLLVTGSVLIIAMIIVISSYFSSKRKETVESHQYEMLKDDEQK